MSNILFSIVVPAYNEEDYLRYCLSSLINQTLSKDLYEIIVVDNASTDKTSQIAKDLGVKVIFEPKKGVVFARQTGASASKGKIIVSFDADSRAPPNWLKNIQVDFLKNPKIIGVTGPYCYLDNNSLSRFYLDSLFWKTVKLSAKIFESPIHISASNFSFKKKAFLEAGGYPLNDGRPADQASFLKRLKKVGRIIFDSNLMIVTSARRSKGRLFRSVIYDGITYTLLDPLYYKIVNKHLNGKAPDIR